MKRTKTSPSKSARIESRKPLDIASLPGDTEGNRTPARLRTLDDLDGRTRAAKLARDLVAALEADLGGDLSAAQRELVTRAALLGAITQDAEANWLSRNPVDLALYGTLADRQRRILEALGLKRVARDVTPDVDSYLRQKRVAA